LWLEITESVAMKNAEFTIAVLRELKKLGVQLAIDDFGKGHSSLTYLIKRFQMDVLKIDRSFVAELARDTDYETIVAGITGIARSLNLRVVAEGIETAEQYAQVRNMGCDTAQGYYFSRPVPSEEASALIAADTHW
jgi:EAL domain-containing protein (putative c-di-GMP-specific phosphodiesterase class I)